MIGAIGAATDAQRPMDAILGGLESAIVIASEYEDRKLQLLQAVCLEERQHRLQQVAAGRN